MPKLIHTISLNNGGSATRESTSRRYSACIVATVTASSVRIANEKVVQLTALLVDQQAALDAALAKWKCTVESAKADHKARSGRWYSEVDGYFVTVRRLREAHALKVGRLRFSEPDYGKEEAVADLIARGFENPYDATGSNYEAVEIESKLTQTRNDLEWRRRMAKPLGYQAVVSWHQTVALATKGLSGAESYRKSGDDLQIRTDITVREVQPRTKRASA